jgi:hypothetical protein
MAGALRLSAWRGKLVRTESARRSETRMSWPKHIDRTPAGKLKTTGRRLAELKRRQELPPAVADAVADIERATALASVFFTDAEARPGYVPRAPRSERERIEGEIANLRRQLWDSPEDRREIEGMIEAKERELRALR